MINRDLIKLLLDQPMDAPVMSWSEEGIKPLTSICSPDGVPDWRKEEANLPTNAIIIPV